MIRWLILVILFVAVITGVIVSRKPSFDAEATRTSFYSYATRISATRNLQLAKINQIEVFERKSTATFLWTQLQLPDVVVGASVPVEYTYFVDLSQGWTFENIDGRLLVTAPPLRPGTPAADISKLRFEVKKGSLFRNEQQVVRGLQNQMTNLLALRASENKNLVRETARKELEALLLDWLKAGGNKPVVQVQFSDDRLATP